MSYLLVPPLAEGVSCYITPSAAENMSQWRKLKKDYLSGIHKEGRFDNPEYAISLVRLYRNG